MTRRAFVGLAAGVALRGETSQEKGRQIIDKAIYALGGNGFRFLQTRTEQGRAYSFYREQISGLSIAHFYTKYTPEGELQRQTFGKKQDDVVILTPTAGWEITYKGAKALPDERIKQFRETMLHDVFYILRSRIDEPGMTFESRGIDVVENQPVEVVDVFDADNRNVTLYIHSSTWLPVKQRFQRWDPVINERREEVTRFTKYREVGNGVKWPYDTQRERDGEKIYEMYSEKVVIGQDLSAAMFQLPAGVTILKK
ncbi:MAG: hypothetical protein ABSB15_03270 [Bryobacteraceae bacterium]|jgi:hypothetical protein